MNILIVGFGNMGCRHAQSFLSDKSNKIYVVEPNTEVFNTNLPRIGSTDETVFRSDFSDIPVNSIDFAVIATSAELRLSLFKQVLALGVKKILLEKVVFQAVNQFEEALKLIEESGAEVYCNFLNRYSMCYNQIKDSIGGNKIEFSVTGGHFGFACNALHYIDLFKYLTGSDVKLITSNIVKSDQPNVRGSRYVEVFGQQIWETKKGDRLFISSDEENNSGKGSENHITYGGNTHVINENTLNQFNIGSGGKLEVVKFDMPMASRLTNTLYSEMISGAIKLPDVKETMKYHVQFFAAVNASLGLSELDLCPIT